LHLLVLIRAQEPGQFAVDPQELMTQTDTKQSLTPEDPLVVTPTPPELNEVPRQQEKKEERDLSVNEMKENSEQIPISPRTAQTMNFNDQFNDLMSYRLNEIANKFPWVFKPDECDLSVELFPLYYVPILRAATTRMRFFSNCMKTREINFDILFNDQVYINWIYHPTTLYVNVWGNVYRLEYSKPEVIDRFDVMKSLQYNKVTIYNASETPIGVDLETRNIISLRPQEMATFTKSNMSRFKALKGYLICKTTLKKLKNWEEYQPKRDKLIQQLRTRGESEEFILNEVDKIMLSFFKAESSPAVVDKKFMNPEEKKTAPMEEVEENERLMAREKAKKIFIREFIEDIEMDCQI